jgi:hypothetical protein
VSAGTSISSGTAGRLAAAAWSGLKATFSHTWNIVHQLFLEVFGLLFLCVAVLGGFAARREYLAYKGGTAPAYRPTVAILFTVMFAWWGVSSFWRARKKAISGKR